LLRLFIKDRSAVEQQIPHQNSTTFTG